MEEAAAPKETDGVRMSSEDDWSSDESDVDKPHRRPPAYTKKDEPENDSDPLEDSEAEPDILDISIHDWDFGLTALGYAIISGEVEVVDVLLAAGADPCFAAHTKNVNPLHPLALTIYTQDEERAAKIAERLVAAQAISSTADDKLFTIFHRIVAAGKTKIVSLLLDHDPNAKKVLNSPAWYEHGLVFPIISAITAGNYATLSVLLAHGAKLIYSPEDVSRAEEKRTGYLPEVLDYRFRIHLPIEAALNNCDEVISLLATLGADVDIPIKSSSNAPSARRVSLLQWTSKAISFLRSRAAPEPIQAPDLPDSPAGDAWSQYRAYLAAVLAHSKTENAPSAFSRGPHRMPRSITRTLRGDGLTARMNYFASAKSILRAHSATIPEESSTSEKPLTGLVGTQTPVTPQESGYIRHGKDKTTPIPAHLKVFYDELYEACWKGDNASIRELCLPKRVGYPNPSSSWMTPFSFQLWHHRNGWTPFLVSLHRRHWDTARLVLAIAMAQYQPPDTDIDATTSVILHDDSDSDDDEPDEHDYGEQKPINFTDIAARPSSVRTDVPPKKMLELETTFLQAGHKHVSCNPLQKAIVDDDFEAFVRTLDLYEFAGATIWPDSGAYDSAVALDRPEMLDELIRRSGVGIPIPSEAVKGSVVDPKAANERVYLGLKVGGKRRADLAKPKQAQRKVLTYNYNLLRSAISSGATKIVDYLAGPRPIAAFTHYVETHNDDIVQYLTGIDNLGAVLPDLLGWKPDELN
ncbi:hypothetical protein EDB89DRAFT_2071544 [Lactarius sanguifluus]|nr:hypothetical protein EDB89DRAFT_2071544 [Lactarius sanguifluus]